MKSHIGPETSALQCFLYCYRNPSSRWDCYFVRLLPGALHAMIALNKRNKYAWYVNCGYQHFSEHDWSLAAFWILFLWILYCCRLLFIIFSLLFHENKMCTTISLFSSLSCGGSIFISLSLARRSVMLLWFFTPLSTPVLFQCSGGSRTETSVFCLHLVNTRTGNASSSAFSYLHLKTLLKKRLTIYDESLQRTF